MITKYYEYTKKIIKENFTFLLSIIIMLLIFLYPLPYYIYSPGGILDVNDRFSVSSGYSHDGSFYLTYVGVRNATIPLYLFSKIKKDWEIVPKKEVIGTNETNHDNDIRDHLLLDESNDFALINAYNLANKKIYITKKHLFISYVSESIETKLKIGDEILTVNNIEVHTKSDIKKILDNYKENDVIKFKVIRNNKEMVKTTKLTKVNNQTKIGIIVTSDYEITTKPSIKFKFKNNESGPSGGFMMSLAIYNALTKDDITKGYKIAGTGTIEENGNVGEIGGIEYKIKAAEKANADYFFAPSGDNYRDAKRIAQKNKYHIKVIEFKNMKDAIAFLKNLS